MTRVTNPQPTTLEASPAPPISFAEAQRQHAAAMAEVARLRELITGTVTTTEIHQVPHRYLTPEGPRGTVKEALAEVERRVEREVEPAERLRARHQLKAAEEAVWLAEAAVEAAKVADAAAARDRMTQAMVEGRRIVETELPALIREQRALQRKWQALQARLERCDHQAGGVPHFGPAAWPQAMAVAGSFDGFVRFMISGYDLRDVE